MAICFLCFKLHENDFGACLLGKLRITCKCVNKKYLLKNPQIASEIWFLSLEKAEHQGREPPSIKTGVLPFLVYILS